MHRGDTLIKEGTKCFLHCSQHSQAKFDWSDSLCRAALGQGHRSIHNQTTGHQNHHGPHSCHEGPYPHCGRPLPRRWVSLFLSTYDITHQPQRSRSSVIGLWPWACWGGVFPLVRQLRLHVVALAEWLTRYWALCLLFGGKVLSSWKSAVSSP